MSSWLEPLTAARGVAVVGASADPRRPGGRVVAYLLRYGFAGAIYPINPRHQNVQGLPAFPRVQDAPGPVDVAMISVPAPHVLAAVEDCAHAGVRLIVIGSAGFGESGPEGVKLERDLHEMAERHGVRVIGPNTNGVIDASSKLTATFTPTLMQDGLTLRPGTVALVSQSGALGAAMLSLAAGAGLALDVMVNTGNETDVTLEEVIDDLVRARPLTGVLGYVEGLSAPDRLIAAACHAAQVDKRIVILKVGTSAAGASAAAAHTAKLAGSDRVFSGVLAQLGILRAATVEHLVDVGRLLARFGPTIGSRITVATLSGGVGIILADLIESTRLSLADWDDGWQAKLEPFLPDYLSKANPIDLAGGPFWDTDKLCAIVRTIDANPASDVTLLAMANFESEQRRLTDVLTGLAPELSKPLAIVWVGATLPARSDLNQAGIPAFAEPARAIEALAPIINHRPGTAIQVEVPTAIGAATIRRGDALRILHGSTPGSALGPAAARELLELYGVPCVEEVSIASAEQLHSVSVPSPAVAKLIAAELPHKSDVGGVITDLSSESAIEAAVERLFALAQSLGCHDASVLLQRRVPAGLELLLGMIPDGTFGPVVTLGLGGYLAEALDDVVIRLPVLRAEDVVQMLGDLHHQQLLRGYRGLPPVDPHTLVPAVLGFSELVSEVGLWFDAIDINPVVVGAGGPPTAVDSLFLRSARTV